MSRNLRLLHIGNGRAFKIRAILEGLLARGHEIHMVPIPPGQGGFEGVTNHHLDDSWAPGRARVIHRFWALRSLVRRLQPDIVHAHNAWGPGWYGAATGWHPFVIHAYGGDLLAEQYSGRPAIQRHLTSWACRAADRIIVTGRHMISASSALGIDPQRIVLLPRGVDLTRYRPGLDVTRLRSELGLSGQGPIILSPRYQVDEDLYNLDIVVDAFADVLKSLPDAVCLQMYDPDRVRGIERLRGLSASRGLGDSYRLIPGVSNSSMPLYYNLADVAVSVPSSDGFPVTILEASACGCPLIVSDLPYCTEWFVQRENGVIVGLRDKEALASAIIEVCTTPQLRQRLASAGRRKAEATASYERCMDDLEALYMKLLGNPEAP